MTTAIDAPDIKRKLPAEIYTASEVAALVKACSTKAKTGIRNRALIVVLYRAGLRISEALSLCPKDLDREAGTLRVLRGKGDKSRVVGLDDGAFQYIERWLDIRASLKIGNRAPVFCTLAGEPIESAYIRALLPRLGKVAGIEKRIHAHGMRHAFACEMAEAGVELRIISAALGHSSLQTTDVYLNHLRPEKVIEAMRARVWQPEPEEEASDDSPANDAPSNPPCPKCGAVFNVERDTRLWRDRSAPYCKHCLQVSPEAS